MGETTGTHLPVYPVRSHPEVVGNFFGLKQPRSSLAGSHRRSDVVSRRDILACDPHEADPSLLALSALLFFWCLLLTYSQIPMSG